jgi:hypothetical protein
MLYEHGILEAVASLCVWIHALLYAGGPGQLLFCVKRKTGAANACLSCDDTVLSSHGSAGMPQLHCCSCCPMHCCRCKAALPRPLVEPCWDSPRKVNGPRALHINSWKDTGLRRYQATAVRQQNTLANYSDAAGCAGFRNSEKVTTASQKGQKGRQNWSWLNRTKVAPVQNPSLQKQLAPAGLTCAHV